MSAARSGESLQPETGGGYLFGQNGHGVVAAVTAVVHESEPGHFHPVFVLPGEISIVTRLVGGSLSAGAGCVMLEHLFYWSCMTTTSIFF
jgi:hypothetical protein